MSGTNLTIETTVSESLEKIWEYYTNPKHIIKWNFASDDWHCPRADNNLIAGGKFSFRMEAKNGSFGFDFEGMYDEVIDLKKIAYSLADGRKVITDFEQIDDLTTVKARFDVDNENPVEMQKEGWLSILNNFKKYVEQT